MYKSNLQNIYARQTISSIVLKNEFTFCSVLIKVPGLTLIRTVKTKMHTLFTKMKKREIMNKNQEVIQTSLDGTPSSGSSQVVNVMYEKPERNNTWWCWGVGILLILLLFVWILGVQQVPISTTSIPQNIGLLSQGMIANQVQTNVVGEQLYITNGQTKMVSVVDSKTNQVKTVIPFG